LGHENIFTFCYYLNTIICAVLHKPQEKCNDSDNDTTMNQ